MSTPDQTPREHPGSPEHPGNSEVPATPGAPGGLTHVRADGSAHMVDVTGKAETSRQAVAEGILRTRPEVVDLIWAGDLPKGDALPVARVAGIMGAKRTPEIIPLCHPLSLGKITVDFQRLPDGVRIEALVRTRGVTGVEMEALTAVSAAALALYDMIKAVDRHAAIEGIRVLAKSGGKSGDWSLPAPRADPAPPTAPSPSTPPPAEPRSIDPRTSEEHA